MQLNTKPLSGIELGTPILTVGSYHARIKAELKANAKGTGDNLVVDVKVLDAVVYAHGDGKEIKNKGQINLRRYVSMVPSDNYDPDKACKELSVALGKSPDEDLLLEDLQGAEIMVKLGYEGDRHDPGTGKTYAASNKVDGFRKTPDDDPFMSANI